MPTIKVLLILVQSILIKRTTNIYFLKDAVPKVTGNSSPEAESNYRRLIRFFRFGRKKYLVELILKFNMQILKVAGPKLFAIDRTNWEFGEKKINLLVLSYIYEGVSIPIAWIQLDKKGNSNSGERMRVMAMAAQLCQVKGALLLADREFIGKRWLGYLRKNGVHVLVRLAKTAYKEDVNQEAGFRHSKLKRIAMGRKGFAYKQIKIGRYNFYYCVLKNPKKDAEEPLLFFLCDLKSATKKEWLSKYTERWTLETCFKHLKTNGFNLEDMNLKNDEKIELMMAVTTMAYCLAIREGFLKNIKKPPKNKRYKDGSVHPAVSVFRIGYAECERKIHNFIDLVCYLTLMAPLPSPP